jgi:hypothetical protein
VKTMEKWLKARGLDYWYKWWERRLTKGGKLTN